MAPIEGTLDAPPRRPRRPAVEGPPPPAPPDDGEGGWRGDGDGRPPGIELFAMKWFVASEAMMFAVLVAVQIALRVRQDEWPPPGQPLLPWLGTAFNSLFLLASGATMRRAERRLAGGDARTGARLLITTSLLATTFLVLQGLEWTRLLHFGLSATASVYGYLFYFIIGVHGLHVAIALGSLLWVTARHRRYGPGHMTGVQLCRMFWLFVVWVWPVLYVTVYAP